jgi:hypothetical protein
MPDVTVKPTIHAFMQAADAAEARTVLGTAAASHTHAIADVTNLPGTLSSLQSQLDDKADAGHIHTIANVTGLQTALDGKQAAGSYAAASHTHAISDVTNLQTTLDGKAASSHTQAASTITDFSEAVDDRVGSLLQAGAGISLNYDDAGNTLTITNTGGGSGGGGGTVTSVAVSGGTTGLTTSGGPVTGSGTITLAGTLAVANGGTGATDAAGARTALGAAAASHTHAIADVTGLQTALDGKSDTTHTHTPASIGAEPAFTTLSATKLPALTGDVTSSEGSAATTVERLRGRTVATTAPTSGQVLSWNSATSQWEPATVTSGSNSLSGDLSGTTSSATVVKIQGTAVAATAPTSGQVLKYNGTAWAPAADTDTDTGITELTGDVTASGSGSQAATLATVNSNVGTFGSASSVAGVTVNAKGLVTAASSVPIAISTSQVTGLSAAAIGAAPASHTHTASNITDFSEAVDDRVAGLLVAGTNISLSYNDSANTLTINSSASGGGAPSGNAGGDLSGTYPNPTLATSGVTAGTYGSDAEVPVLVVDAKGRVTSASTAIITAQGIGAARQVHTHSSSQVIDFDDAVGSRVAQVLVAGTNISLDWDADTKTLEVNNTASGGGSVTSVGVSGGTTGLITSGGPVTSSGTITLAGTLSLQNGGTGVAAPTAAHALNGLLPAQANNSGKYLTTDGTNASWSTVSGGGSGGGVQVDVYTSSVSPVSIPAGAKMLNAFVHGAGGGGGAGYNCNGTLVSCGGGGGGGGGAWDEQLITVDDLAGAQLSVFVGSGGQGGIGGPNGGSASTAGFSGVLIYPNPVASLSAPSVIPGLVIAQGANPGGNGSTSTQGGGAGSSFGWYSGTNGGQSLPGANAGGAGTSQGNTSLLLAATGGGAGGGLSTTSQHAGGAGGAINKRLLQGRSASGGIAGGAVGANALSPQHYRTSGGGGGGGGSNLTGVGGAGGNGAFPGGGGGGGGAGLTNGGNGGNGGNGIVVLTWYF